MNTAPPPAKLLAAAFTGSPARRKTWRHHVNVLNGIPRCCPNSRSVNPLRCHRANTRRICRARGEVVDPNLPISRYLRPHSAHSRPRWGGCRWSHAYVERHGEILEELRAVGPHAGTDLVERLHRQAAGIGGRLQHQRRYRADEDGLGDTFGAVAPDVARDLTATGRVADMDRVLQVERFGQRG